MEACLEKLRCGESRGGRRVERVWELDCRNNAGGNSVDPDVIGESRPFQAGGSKVVPRAIVLSLWKDDFFVIKKEKEIER